MLLWGVSIHAPARGATVGHRSGDTYLDVFQSTHPHGVRLRRYSRFWWTISGFNPRTRTGCDNEGDKGLRSVFAVSIHAPARGATILLMPIATILTVSIHAPARGATV